MNIMIIKKYIIPLFLIFSGSSVAGQETPVEEEPIEPVMEMTYLKDTEGNINLRSSMVNYVNRQPVPLPGLEIIFYAGEDSLVSLGSVTTDKEGWAILVLDEGLDLPVGLDGSVRYFAEYQGTDNILSAEYEVYVTDVNLDMELTLLDSVKIVSLRAYSLVEGEEVPVADEDIYVYVKRMFSDLPLGEDFLDENGEFMTEIPDDIPGDAQGYIEIIGRFNDHYLFGTVENRQTIQWGMPTKHEIPVSQRTLWTQIAPLWMVITLSILLAGVWGHYIFVIIQLFRLRRIARKEESATLV
ncbi:MAG: hypothetical protein KAT31_00350 [Bacteroidales bacterium]|nr:hypothetical protein [Bacteroidales bacterium]